MVVMEGKEKLAGAHDVARKRKQETQQMERTAQV